MQKKLREKRWSWGFRVFSLIYARGRSALEHWKHDKIKDNPYPIKPLWKIPRITAIHGHSLPDANLRHARLQPSLRNAQLQILTQTNKLKPDSLCIYQKFSNHHTIFYQISQTFLILNSEICYRIMPYFLINFYYRRMIRNLGGIGFFFRSCLQGVIFRVLMFRCFHLWEYPIRTILVVPWVLLSRIFLMVFDASLGFILVNTFEPISCIFSLTFVCTV